MRIFNKMSFPLALMAIDLASIIAANWISYGSLYWLSSLQSSRFVDLSTLWNERAGGFIVVVVGLMICGLVNGDYHKRMPYWEDAQNLVRSCVLAFVAEGFMAFAGKADVSRLMIAVSWLLVPFIAMPLRATARKLGRYIGWGVTRALVVGSGDHVEEAVRLLEAEQHLGFVITAAATPHSLEEFEGELTNCNAAAVVFAFDAHTPLEAAIAMRARELGLELCVIPASSSISSGMTVRYVIGEDTVILVDRVESVPKLHRAMKRAFDVVIASSALVFFALPMFMVAVAVRRDGGPAIFAHERIGADGKPFGCMKFRSMAVDAKERLDELLSNDPQARVEWDENRKLKNDPRVTKIGAFIRKTALDELPQLINVLKGQMSLVGPRPVTSDELTKYGDAAALYKSVLPGVTGLWQVSGRSDLSYDARVKLDTWYVRNWTAWHDIAILIKTVPALLSRKGAY